MKTALRELADTLIGIDEGKPWQFYDFAAEKWDDAGEAADPVGTVQVGGKIRLKPPGLTPEQIENGWIPWSGGECPVEPESRPSVMYRINRTIDSGLTQARNIRWHHDNGGGDIIAYRPDPYGKLRHALAEGKTIEYQPSIGSHWHQIDKGMEVGFIAPPDHYRIKEQQWITLGKRDIPPGSVLCPSGFYDSGRWFSIRAVLSDSVLTDGAEDDEDSEHITFESLMRDGWQINRSLSDGPWDPDAWEPCRKEAP